jgi:hypothetical protein
MLIVLDNFEQMLDATPVVADLLQRASRLQALVTSRVVLRGCSPVSIHPKI